MEWFLTNKASIKNGHEISYSTNIDKKSNVFLDGYVIPRRDCFNQYKHYSQIDLIKTLYENYADNFIHLLKGVFTIIIFSGNSFSIFSDRHSIKKYFYIQYSKEFFITNSLTLLTTNYDLKIDRINSALFTLTSHFLPGDTLFKDVKSCFPAQIIKFNGNNINNKIYWHPSEIFNNQIKVDNNILDYPSRWKEIINGYIEYLNPKGISITLTGGNDSRMVLAALMALKLKFRTFTYGNPESSDAVIAADISDLLGIPHSTYTPETYDSDWFEKQAHFLIKNGNSLINIHRAHRNFAAAQESNINGGEDMILTGLVGGEYLKEPKYNNVTLPAIFNQILNNKKKLDAADRLIKESLLHKGISKFNKDDIFIIRQKIIQFLDHGKNLESKKQKFIYTYLFYGCSHHVQDANVFENHFKYVVNPYMDPDFIELLSDYKRWYANNKQSSLVKFFHSELLIKITDSLAPILSDIPYAKKGMYSAFDILNHRLLYIIKRISYIIKKDISRYPPNFPMGEWLYLFCVNKLNQIPKELHDIFDIDFLKMQLTNVRNKKNEADWHIITNPINLSLIYEYFKKDKAGNIKKRASR